MRARGWIYACARVDLTRWSNDDFQSKTLFYELYQLPTVEEE
jgi:hypothetical protein